jgi:hypothetical protein
MALASSHAAEAAMEHTVNHPRRSGTVFSVLLVAAAVAAVGCETSSTITTGPDPVKCQLSLSTPAMLEAVGGSSSVAVTSDPECAWTASTTANWISGLSPTSGQGAATVAFRVAANEGTSAREGIIVINGAQARVAQRAPCRYELRPANQTMSTSGGRSTITVSTLSECAWTATADVNWISLVSEASGSGDGTITFTVTPTQAERTGSIIVAGQRATITQPGVSTPTCDGSISPTSQNIGAAGGTGAIAVLAQSTCSWSAGSDVPWITVTSGATGTGNGSVNFSVAVNTGVARTGTLRVSGRVFTVTQAAAAAPAPGCTYLISPTSQNAPAGGHTGTVNVTTTTTCAWTAISNAAWLTVTSGAAGTGNGSVGFTAAANTGVARTGTLTIAGQTFTVSQAAGVAPCTYSISPTSQNVDAAANTGTVTVTTAVGCAWTGISNAAWLTVTAGASGAGNGAVGFSVAANTGVARTGTLTIAGQVFTVSQAAVVVPCTYSISPASQTVIALGGSGTVAVTTTSGCAWTASSNAPWITVTSGAAGTGSGSVGFGVGINLLGARTGTLTIAGQTFTVNQDAVLP